MHVFVGSFLRVPKVPFRRRTVTHLCSNDSCGKHSTSGAKFCQECGSAIKEVESWRESEEYPRPDLYMSKWVDFVAEFQMADGSVVWIPNKHGSPGEHWTDTVAVSITRADVTQRTEEAEDYFREFMAEFKKSLDRELELDYGVVVGRYR